ncbi:MAG: oxidoreductase [Acidobacteria bacterium]|nr:MAG: oxidoreductase [Acidobacteriota bacterium]
MPKQKLNVAMIGAGFIAKAHSNAFQQVGRFFPTPFEFGLRVICARNQAKLEVMASHWGWQEVSTDWREIVSRKDVQVVDIAVPNALHGPIALAAAAAGKILLCEKPLAVSLEEAENMAKAAHHVPNLVWFNYRRVPAVAFAKKLIEEGRLGEAFHYRALYLNQSGNDPAKASGWRYQRAQAGSGATGDLLAHSIDTALYLNGPITQLFAMTRTFFPNRDVDDAVVLMCRFANGSMGTFEATRYGIGCRNRNAFEMNGSKGMVRFNLEDMNWLEFFDASEAPRFEGSRKIMVTGPDHPYWENFWKPGHIIGYEHTFIATLGDFLASLERKQPFHPNFDDAVAVQRVLDAVERSATARNWVSLV